MQRCVKKKIIKLGDISKHAALKGGQKKTTTQQQKQNCRVSSSLTGRGTSRTKKTFKAVFSKLAVKSPRMSARSSKSSEGGKS